MEQGSGRCCAGGKCCGNSGMGRRDFLKAAAVTAGGLALLGSGGLARAATSEDAAALRAWTESLWKRGERRVYRGEELEQILFPLGGVGAGQVYLTGDGRLDGWQIINNFKMDAHAPGAHFGLWTRAAGQTRARLLQQGESGGVPGVETVEFSGEYPYAWLNYVDKGAPVSVSLEAFTPLLPLEADESGLPMARFTFTLQNRTQETVEAAVLATAPNLIGWDGYAALQDTRYGEYTANFNAVEDRADVKMLHMQTRPGTPARLADPRNLLTGDAGLAESMRYCENAKVQWKRFAPKEEELASAVVWLRKLDEGSTQALKEGLDALQNGAVLILAGAASSLLSLASADAADDGRIVFEDWEKGNFDGWTIEGNCFGTAPATGTLPNQQQVSGWAGKGYLNSYAAGDDATGRMTSKPFTVERSYVHIQVGGGNWPNEACVNFVVDGKTVHSATGENTEQLRPVSWDVTELRGKTATIEIVDTREGGWGHILVGDIVFSDSAVSPFVDPALLQRCREMLPMSWTTGQIVETPAALREGSPLLAGLEPVNCKSQAYVRFENLQLKPEARVLLESADGAPLVVAGPAGKGTVVVCNGPVHEWFGPQSRRTVAGNLIAAASGTAFTPQTGWAPESVPFGTMALAALPNADEVSSRPQWDDFGALWEDFSQDGRIEPAGSGEPSEPGHTWNGALCSSVRLEPGAQRQVSFVLAWHFPNRTRDHRYAFGPWAPGQYQYDFRLGNRYANRFKSAAEVVAYYAANAERLDGGTRLFHETLYDTTLPRWLIDSITANVSTVRSPIFIWLEDGTFGGFEGTDACCPLNCTHVYNYAMTTAYLFPSLERNVRELDLLVQMQPEQHFIPHRLVVPLSQPRMENEIGGPHHHALDGELGTLLKTCREWRLNGDNEWLGKLWPNMRKVMEHVLRDHDEAGDGVLKGEQPNTYDTHLYGSNTFVGSLYLASLRAMEEMAKAMGDSAFAGVCRERFQKGYEGYDRTCWNGEYYENIFDAPDATPETYNQNNCYGPGCFSDQLLGQWWAWLLDLGEILPPEHVKTALQSVYKYNWRSDLSNHVHNQRVFAEGNEKGLLTGTWPKGGRPERPILYCDEVWTGIEYHVAASLIQLGLIEEGLQMAKGARDRYTGNNRNPWAEIECGVHYARAMSSWSLLSVLSGCDYDGPTKRLGIAPRLTPDAFRSFFSADNGWGSLRHERSNGTPRIGVDVKGGSVRVASLRVPVAEGTAYSQAAATLDGANVPCSVASNEGRCVVTFDRATEIGAGQSLRIELRKA